MYGSLGNGWFCDKLYGFDFVDANVNPAGVLRNLQFAFFVGAHGAGNKQIPFVRVGGDIGFGSIPARDLALVLESDDDPRGFGLGEDAVPGCGNVMLFERLEVEALDEFAQPFFLTDDSGKDPEGYGQEQGRGGEQVNGGNRIGLNPSGLPALEIADGVRRKI